ncbi:collagen alpha-2(I) chain-like [Mirounga angustirostris]|uniref:collagen alpha-2(I) chain-like n=1 Tax=Mirounga angustirostris TaxID=9716 RepID=UPI00313D683E
MTSDRAPCAFSRGGHARKGRGLGRKPGGLGGPEHCSVVRGWRPASGTIPLGDLDQASPLCGPVSLSAQWVWWQRAAGWQAGPGQSRGTILGIWVLEAPSCEAGAAGACPASSAPSAGPENWVASPPFPGDPRPAWPVWPRGWRSGGPSARVTCGALNCRCHCQPCNGDSALRPHGGHKGTCSLPARGLRHQRLGQGPGSATPPPAAAAPGKWRRPTSPAGGQARARGARGRRAPRGSWSRSRPGGPPGQERRKRVGGPLGAGAARSRVHAVSAGGRGGAGACTRSGRPEALGTRGPGWAESLTCKRPSAFPFIEQPAREGRPE